MRQFALLVKRLFAAAIAASLAPFAFASSAYAVDAGPHFETRTLNLGLVRSIAVPDIWKIGEVNSSTSSKMFFKDGKDIWDCTQHFEVCAPVHAEAGLLLRLNELTLLSNKLSAADLDSIKALPYFGEFSNNESDALGGTVYGINGRRIVVVERSERRIGVCQPIAGGGRRRPLISSVAGVAYIPVGKETLQVVKFASQVMGETTLCEKVIRSMLKSIEWQDQ